MKNIILLILLSPIYMFAQQDPEAKVILDKAAEKTNSFKTIAVNFEVDIRDRKEKTSMKSTGSIIIKGEKYKLNADQSEVYFDGKTMWTYIQEINEVTITEPDMDDEDFLGNPAKILRWYNRDFKYRYVQETTFVGTPVHEIDLFPKNLDQPYTRIKLFIGKNDLLLYSLSSAGKDGIDYAVTLSDYQIDKEVKDALFTFDLTKHTKIEVVDLRF